MKTEHVTNAIAVISGFHQDVTIDLTEGLRAYADEYELPWRLIGLDPDRRTTVLETLYKTSNDGPWHGAAFDAVVAWTTTTGRSGWADDSAWGGDTPDLSRTAGGRRGPRAVR